MNTPDENYLEQVRSLTSTAKMAIEEAEQYMELIFDESLKKEAERMIGNV